jgi:hypothetical protein
VADSFNINDWINMKNTVSHKDGFNFTQAATFSFFDKKLNLKVGNEMGFPDKGKIHLFSPNISLVSSQIEPFTLSASGNADGSLGFNLTRAVSSNEKFGY